MWKDRHQGLPQRLRRLATSGVRGMGDGLARLLRCGCNRWAHDDVPVCREPPSRSLTGHCFPALLTLLFLACVVTLALGLIVFIVTLG